MMLAKAVRLGRVCGSRKTGLIFCPDVADVEQKNTEAAGRNLG
ncbi:MULTISPECIES: hypothetical protein [Rhizobium]|nr:MULTISPECIES: hypothetical protein [Rhizobium]